MKLRCYSIRYWCSSKVKISHRLTTRGSIVLGPHSGAGIRIRGASVDSFLLDFESSEIRFLNSEQQMMCPAGELCLLGPDALIWKPWNLMKALKVASGLVAALCFFAFFQGSPEIEACQDVRVSEENVFKLRRAIAAKRFVKAQQVLKRFSGTEMTLCEESTRHIEGYRSELESALIVNWIDAGRFSSLLELVRNAPSLLISNKAKKHLRLQARAWMWTAWKKELEDPVSSVELLGYVELVCQAYEKIGLCDELPKWEG